MTIKTQADQLAEYLRNVPATRQQRTMFERCASLVEIMANVVEDSRSAQAALQNEVTELRAMVAAVRAAVDADWKKER